MQLTYQWTKCTLLSEQPSVQLVKAIFDLSISQYAEVRSTAQELLQKVLRR